MTQINLNTSVCGSFCVFVFVYGSFNTYED